MTDACDICQTLDSMTPILEVGLVGVGPAWIHRCAGCGFRQVRPRLGPAELEAIYGGDYFDPAVSSGFEEYARQYQRYEREAYFLARRLRRRRPRGRLLEVGSALGFLLNALARASEWQVEGVELSAFGAWYARERFGLTVSHSTLEGARYPTEAFDFVIQKDLLEHVTHPRRHLEETRRVMRRGARLWLVTPNGETNVRPLQSLAADLDDGAVPVLDQGHLSFFSRGHLLRLAADVGFRCVRFRNIGIRRGMRALGYLPGRSGRPSAVSRRDLVATRGPRAPDASAPQPDVVDAHRAVAARIDREVETRQRRVRASIPYFYYRRAMKRLDALPAAFTVGQDFEVELEKV